MFTGVYSSVLIPFDGGMPLGPPGQRSRPDEKRLCELVERQIDSVDGMVVGLPFSCNTYADWELTRALYAVRDTVNGRVPILSSAWPVHDVSDTEEILQRLIIVGRRHGGTDAVLVIAPPPQMDEYGNDQPHLIDFYRTIAEESETPIIIFVMRAADRSRLPRVRPETLEQLVSEVPNIVGIFDQTADPQRTGEFHAAVEGREDFTIFGADTDLPAHLSMGASAVISTTASIDPAHVSTVFRLFQSGQHQEALAVYQQLVELNQLLYVSGGFPYAHKYVGSMIGLPVEIDGRNTLSGFKSYHERIVLELERLGLMTERAA